jgi:hypothetical protein
MAAKHRKKQAIATYTPMWLKQVCQALAYDKMVGGVVWVEAAPGRVIGKRAGTPRSNKYRYINVLGRLISEHRLVWFIHHSAMPKSNCVIDHINGNRADNRIENLRCVPQVENCRNRNKKKRNSSSKYLGVSRDKNRNNWHASVGWHGQTINVGRFTTAKAAAMARDAAAFKLDPKNFTFNFPRK